MVKKRTHRNPLKAIRAKCLECCGGSPKEVRLCPDATCALHPFRSGSIPVPRRKRRLKPLSQKDPALSTDGAASPSRHREVQRSLFQD